jgi:hypothetical protein
LGTCAQEHEAGASARTRAAVSRDRHRGARLRRGQPLDRRAPVEEAIRHFESLLEQPSYAGFFPKLSARDVDRCLDEFEADERWHVEFGASVLQAVSITQWLIDGIPRNTRSALHVHYGSMPVLGTMLGFESIEEFRSVKAALESIKLCKLNEKHLKERRHA